MERGWDDFADLHAALVRLEEIAGHPVVLVASGWRGPKGVNFDLDAVRVLRDITRSVQGAPFSLFVMGRGGMASFADGARRLFSGQDVQRCYVADFVRGAASVITLMAKEIVLMPGAGVGAPGAGPLGPGLPIVSEDVVRRAPHDLFGYEEQDRRELLGLAQQRAAREHLQTALNVMATVRLGGKDASGLSNALSAARLGDGMALGARELDALGVSARVTSEGEEGACWELLRACEAVLELELEPAKPYTLLADGEVEFELATGKPGGLIATSRSVGVFELDTGSPDPDTGLYEGGWIF